MSFTEYISNTTQTNLSVLQYLQQIGYKYKNWLAEINQYETKIKTAIINSEIVPFYLTPNKSIQIYRVGNFFYNPFYHAETLLMRQVFEDLNYKMNQTPLDPTVLFSYFDGEYYILRRRESGSYTQRPQLISPHKYQEWWNLDEYNLTGEYMSLGFTSSSDSGIDLAKKVNSIYRYLGYLITSYTVWTLWRRKNITDEWEQFDSGISTTNLHYWIKGWINYYNFVQWGKVQSNDNNDKNLSIHSRRINLLIDIYKKSIED